MERRNTDFLPSYDPTRIRSNNSSSVASASASSNSIWSDVTSQSSDNLVIYSVSNDKEASNSYFCMIHSTYPYIQNNHKGVPAEQRRHSRWTSEGSISCLICLTPIVRQCVRKVNFIDSFVDISTQIVETIWPLSSIASRSKKDSERILPLPIFIQEVLRRSHTSHSILHVALYYLILIKPHIPETDLTLERSEEVYSLQTLQCGRRMFLSALILASKYLEDRIFSARAWSTITGLSTHEINQNEMAFLSAVEWKLHITDDALTRWSNTIL